MTIATLGEQIRILANLKTRKKELAELVKANNADIEDREKEITSAMLDMADAAGLDDAQAFTVAVDGRRYGMIVKPFYSIKAEDRDVAFPLLREVGLGDLIVERVDERTLTKALQQITEENAGQLPEQYAALPLSTYEKITISDRKI